MYAPRRFFGIFGAAMLAAVAHSHAIVLDWSTVSWAPGSLSNAYDIDGFSQNGNDISITVSGNTNKLTTDPVTGLAAPSIAASLEGGTGGDHSLILAGDLSTQTNFTVTVTFTGMYNAATDVSFTIFDIDMGVDREKILNIYGLLSNGTKVAPTITNLGSAVTLNGTDFTQVLTGNAASPDTGPNSANGNVTISFGNVAIQSFTFDFKNDGGPPRFQSVSLYDINFTPVPEINPALTAALSCFTAGGLVFFHRARVRSRRQ